MAGVQEGVSGYLSVGKVFMIVYGFSVMTDSLSS